ncbi:serine hydrolase domain-containing protein [Alkalihalobacillus sp. R86527]|uniref:serine hydrolase domain-containing protein n=1 Tax=Alkalihalobacillus sp. R86527 TaxID=3093863 RepID=UPI003670A3DC
MNKLVSWVEEIKDKNASTAAALIVMKDNEVVLEHYSGKHSNTEDARQVDQQSRFNVASARKSYLGLAVAYAIYEGKITSLDDYARNYFDDIDHELLGATTIRHLVTHSHGLDENLEGNLIREFEPGESWAYRGINIVMMTKLIHNLYEKNFPQLLKERVFEPLGFTKTWWEVSDSPELVSVIVDPADKGETALGMREDGLEKNLFVNTREFAEWGKLFLNRGKMNGKQIVPEAVMELATTIQSPPYADKELPQNGLFWFVQDEPRERSELGSRVPRGSYQILGVTGPTLLVIPEYNVVVAKMYNKRYNYGGENYLYYLKEFSNLVADSFCVK